MSNVHRIKVKTEDSNLADQNGYSHFDIDLRWTLFEAAQHTGRSITQDFNETPAKLYVFVDKDTSMPLMDWGDIQAGDELVLAEYEFNRYIK